MKSQEFFNLTLTKWPRLLVVGDDVTEEQAMEILIRTDSLSFSSNDLEFSKQLNKEFFGVETPAWNLDDAVKDLLKTNDWDKCNDYIESCKQQVSQLGIDYLTNSRIVSCWYGGTKGWCDWNGKIYTSNYNIGTWPSVEEVYDEWCVIAEAFPFLRLKAQLLNVESDTSDIETVLEPVVEFHIESGTVTMVAPETMITKTVDIDFLSILSAQSYKERGCTIEQFKTAVNFVKDKLKLLI